ncbi:MAG: hypothetical protein ABIG39_05285 [Candidatus Micrarchaeota archaeon]
MEILNHTIDSRVIIGLGALLATITIVLAAYLLLTLGGGHERELFSLMPPDGISEVAYLVVEDGSMGRVLSHLDPNVSRNVAGISGLSAAIGTYDDGSVVIAAFVKTDMSVGQVVEAYGSIVGEGTVAEDLIIGGTDVRVVYLETDSGREAPVCIWQRDDGVGILLIEQVNASKDYCHFPSEISCRGQMLKDSYVSIKVKGEGENIVITEAACSEMSLSSKSIEYSDVGNLVVGVDEETWIYGIPCYDASNNLIEKDSIYGKIFLKYHFESEGSRNTRILTGNIGVTSESVEGESLAGKRCIDLLETRYDNSDALSMLSKAGEPTASVPVIGNALGNARFSDGQERIYISAYEEYGTDYAVVLGDVSLVGRFKEGVYDSRCVSSEEAISEIIINENSNVCRRPSRFGPFGGTGYERKTDAGDMLLMLVFPTDGREPSGIPNVVFEIGLDGTDIPWRNETVGKVTVRLVDEMCLKEKPKAECVEPVEGAEVELYSSNANGSRGAVMDTGTSDSSGFVEFKRVPLNGGFVVVSKYGYEDLLTGKKLSEDVLTGENNFSAVIDLVQPSNGSELLDDYMIESEFTTINAGLPDVRGVFPALLAYGMELVNSGGWSERLVVVGVEAPAEEVAKASHIAEILAGANYMCDVPIAEGEYGAIAFDIALNPIMITDKEKPEGIIIAVGNPETNAVLREKGDWGLEQNDTIKVVGNTIMVIGSGHDAMESARELISGLEVPHAECGSGSSYEGITVIDSEGRPAKVVIGTQSSIEEATAGAYIAVQLASLSSRCVRTTKDMNGCVSMRSINPVNPIVLDDSVPDGRRVISVGGWNINRYTKQNCVECGEIEEGEAIIMSFGGDIFISGYRMDDTASAVEELASGLSKPIPPTQKSPYYGIKISGFTEKEDGHHEVGLSFYDKTSSIQTGTAGLEKRYVMHGGEAVTIVSIYARDLGSASVTFEVDGKEMTVLMGKYLCHGGTIEDSFEYCTKERIDTQLAVDVDPKNAILMERFQMFAEYTQEYGSVPGALCVYCITGKSVVCGSMEYGWPLGMHSHEILLKNMSTGTHWLNVNCSSEGYKNATEKTEFYITRMELPDLVIDGLWVNSLVQTKMTATVRMKNIGTSRFEATASKPLVICMWDGSGRHLLSYASYNATMEPGETFQITQTFILPLLGEKNSLLAKVECNNIYPEENEDNNEKGTPFGKYG